MKKTAQGSCDKCIYWGPRKMEQVTRLTRYPCRYGAPVIRKARKNDPAYMSNTDATWPLSAADDWCGEFEARPTPERVEKDTTST